MSDSTRLPFEKEHGEVDTEALFSHVLIIEDEITHARLLERSLKGVVGEVTIAQTGQEAVQAISSGLYELAFCDLHLPDADGVSLVAEIGRARPGLPIIVMTSSSKIDDVVSVMRAGAWDYMVKEFDPSFRDRLSILVNRNAARKAREMRELLVRAERDAFATAVRAAQDGVAVLDMEGELVFANEAFKKFHSMLPGAGGEYNSGCFLSAIKELDPNVAEKLQAQLGQHTATFWRSEIRVPRPEGVDLYLELSHTAIAMNESEGEESPIYIRRNVLWARDISERKSREKFQRDVLSTTSHDLKGPLGAILTSVDLLQTANLSGEKVGELATRIGSCARSCVELIDDVLNARRIQDGVLVVRPRELKLIEVLEDIILDYETMAGSKQMDFGLDDTDSELRIFADRISLQRVLSNLVSNAIKFTDNGGQVRLRAWRQNDEVLISVSDTGSGIDDAAYPGLFEQYSRLDQHDQVEGTGLGLFVAKSIVDAHSGRIEVVSRVGEGTTFVVAFPDNREEES